MRLSALLLSYLAADAYVRGRRAVIRGPSPIDLGQQAPINDSWVVQLVMLTLAVRPRPRQKHVCACILRVQAERVRRSPPSRSRTHPSTELLTVLVVQQPAAPRRVGRAGGDHRVPSVPLGAIVEPHVRIAYAGVGGHGACKVDGVEGEVAHVVQRPVGNLYSVEKGLN